MICVVDTNVPKVSNGKSVQASSVCVLSCVKKIQEIMKNGTIVIDDKWLIVKEYMNNLKSEGQPGVGDAFLKWVLSNTKNSKKCNVVTITPIDSHDPNQFKEFPSDIRLSGFDPSDRKFIAVSIAHKNNPPILQAVDRKWWNYREIFKQNDVRIEFLCIQDCQD